MPWIETLVAAVVSAVVASGAFWAAKRRGTGEPFRPRKAVPVIVVSFVIALVLLLTGIAESREGVMQLLPVFVGPMAAWVQELVQRFRATAHEELRGAEWGSDRKPLLQRFRGE